MFYVDFFLVPFTIFPITGFLKLRISYCGYMFFSEMYFSEHITYILSGLFVDSKRICVYYLCLK